MYSGHNILGTEMCLKLPFSLCTNNFWKKHLWGQNIYYALILILLGVSETGSRIRGFAVLVPQELCKCNMVPENYSSKICAPKAK